MAELLKTFFSQKFKKQYKKLPKNIQNKFTKQLQYLAQNYRHPSLQTRKMTGDIFEGRIDYHYRFTFCVEEKTVFLLSIGPHDTGLGKK